MSKRWLVGTALKFGLFFLAEWDEIGHNSLAHSGLGWMWPDGWGSS
jgi:hypothetical protein